MSDPDNEPLTDSDLKRMKRTPQIKVVRRALQLTQEEFAARYQIAIGTLRDWEQNRCEPDEAAKAYLKVIAREPGLVRRATGENEMDHFDLRERGWIPVRESSGAIREIGLKEVMRRAHELRQVEGESPLETVSLYRLLVGLAHHLIGDFRSVGEWREIGAQERFGEAKVRWYFHDSPWADRFGLFDEAFPFWQCPGLVNIDAKTNAERPIPVASLIHSVASGNNKTLFSHQTDNGDFSLNAPEAARALVTAQYFSVGGLHKKSSNYFGFQQSCYHAPFVPGMPCIVMGHTLFESIVLNMLPGEYRGAALSKMALGEPPWAESREQIINPQRVAAKNTTTPASYLDYLLPRSRHIRLLREEERDGTPAVREMHIAQGVAWESKIEPWFVNVHNSSKPETAPLKLDLDRAVWRNSTAYLGWRSREQDKQYLSPENLLAYGRYWSGKNRQKSLLARVTILALASNKAKPLAWRHETLDLPVEAMEDDTIMQDIQASWDIVERVHRTLQWAIEGYYQAIFPKKDNGNNANPRKKKKQDYQKKAECSAALRTYWGAVEQPFRAVLVRESSWQECSAICMGEARRIFKHTMNAVVGGNLNLFPARAQAEARFFGSLKKMEKKLTLYAEEAQDGEQS